jgi:hypothetical protein
LVLDLDETLVHSIAIKGDEAEGLKAAERIGVYTKPAYKDIMARSYRIKLNDPTTPKGTGVIYGCWGVTRPHALDFLRFAFRYFKAVIIWSAGVTEYVDEICRLLSRDLRPFDILYTRDDCVMEGEICTKPLAKLIKNHPEFGDLNNILIVDDKLDGCLDNPDNAIIIPPYRPKATVSSIRSDDDMLVRLQAWFETDEVINANDVRTLDKSNIFGVDI